MYFLSDTNHISNSYISNNVNFIVITKKSQLSECKRISKLQYNIACGNAKLCSNINDVHFNTGVKFNMINTLYRHEL